MTLCADNNMYILNCTTRPIYFMLFEDRRRVISNLGDLHPKKSAAPSEVYQSLTDFGKGTCFKKSLMIIMLIHQRSKECLFCNGKILRPVRRQQLEERKDVAVVRLEQLYPMATDQIMEIRNRYVQAQEWFWVQEEPENMGAQDL